MTEGTEVNDDIKKLIHLFRTLKDV